MKEFEIKNAIYQKPEEQILLTGQVEAIYNELKKDKVLKIYVSAKEHAEIKSDIAKKGISISDYFLKLYHNKPLIVREKNEAFNNIRDLRGVANNINQIAKKLNETNPSEILSSTMLQINMVSEKVNNLLDQVE